MGGTWRLGRQGMFVGSLKSHVREKDNCILRGDVHHLAEGVAALVLSECGRRESGNRGKRAW